MLRTSLLRGKAIVATLPAEARHALVCTSAVHVSSTEHPITTAISTAASSVGLPCAAIIGSGALGGFLQPTRLLRRPQTIKPNPNETTSGKFDKSFEKLTETIESRLPFRQRHFGTTSIYDVNFGEKSESEMHKEAEEDLQGREKEKPAARQARSYFSNEDLSPEALRVRSPQLKVAQNAQRQKYDKKLLKTTTEAAEYYYPVVTAEERRRHNAILALGWGVVGLGGFVGLRKAAAYMRTAG